ncbi:TRAP transporter small permease subunit [Roseibium aggregatum]|uniref:TRAP transporter small permease protein n=1 Tax=Roseibium aggregatum TaxID=187304 RepID=A0A0M6YEM0_9HYPH|nr:TRAP transporter small permease subunit [Roseibium aggregatum]CTQ47461.1 TRAP-type mannitol/chloroaromatic compound transport system, small permease component [Roseibium aggregatum]
MSEDKRRKELEATSSLEPDDLQYVVHHAKLPVTRFSRSVDGAIARMGSLISWFWILLMGVICLNVFMKNILGQGSVKFEEIQWHIYAALFLLGLSYTMVYDDHVRVDLAYETFSLRTKAWVDFVGILVFLIPFLAIVLYFAWPFVAKAYADGERSSSPAGLAHYWIIKSALLAGLGLLLLAALSRLHRCAAYLFFGVEPETNGTGSADR